MSVSLVIPTLNAVHELPKLLSAIENQNRVPDEVVVIDSSSDDKTVEVAKTFPLVKTIVIPRKDFDHGGTRHTAFEATAGDFVLFMTQDALPADNTYVEHLLEPFVNSEVAMTSGRQLPKADARRFEQLVREFNYPLHSNVRSIDDLPRLGIKTYFASDACSAYRREAYFACGGFASPCNTNEDMLMAARFIHKGYKVAYVANAKVLHSHNLSPVEQYRRNREVGIFLEKHADDLRCPDEMGEGGSLVNFVSSQLVMERRFGELVAFGVDCAARLLGNRVGRATAKRKANSQ